VIEALIGGIIALIATGAVVLFSEAATEMEAVNKNQASAGLSLSPSDETAIDDVKAGYPLGSPESAVQNDEIMQWIKNELSVIGVNDD